MGDCGDLGLLFGRLWQCDLASGVLLESELVFCAYNDI